MFFLTMLSFYEDDESTEDLGVPVTDLDNHVSNHQWCL